MITWCNNQQGHKYIATWLDRFNEFQELNK